MVISKPSQYCVHYM